MASDIVLFVPKAKRSAQGNLSDFVELCKTKLTVFGAGLPFEDDIWDVSDSVNSKGNKFAIRLRFSNWETADRKNAMVALQEPFKSFAKAFIRYQHACAPRTNYAACLTALRALEMALADCTGTQDPTNISPEVLNHTIEMLKGALKPASASNCGSELQTLSRFVSDLRLVSVPFLWKSPLPPRQQTRLRIGKQFDELRMEKMPSPAAFYALGHIFQNAIDAEDILVSSVCALLCSAPSRISEVVLLPSACEVEQVATKTGEKAYGLGWRPAKDGKPMVKYIASPMHDVVREALARLRALSQPALELVRWYEANPTRLYLPLELEHLRDKPAISMRELDNIIYGVTDIYRPGRPFLLSRSMELPAFKRGGLRYVSFADVEAKVVGLLPRGFPILDAERGLKYSEALMVVRKGELDTTRASYTCMFQPIEPNDINNRIRIRASGSIFTKHGFQEDDGTPIELSTHKFRHYLNTLGQANCMDQLDLARWSGRRNVSQNAVYDHVSEREVTAKLRLALQGESEAVGPIARLHTAALVPRDQFARLSIPTAHTTDLGYCVHDFTMLPCQKHGDCINCEEQVCIKGDLVREARIRASKCEVDSLLEKARVAMKDGEYGADKWVAHHKLTQARLSILCAILDDPAVPTGAIIRLADSPVQTALEGTIGRRAITFITSPTAEPAETK